MTNQNLPESETSLEEALNRDILPMDSVEKQEGKTASVTSEADALVNAIVRLSDSLFSLDKK